jgi:hypothetical protein
MHHKHIMSADGPQQVPQLEVHNAAGHPTPVSGEGVQGGVSRQSGRLWPALNQFLPDLSPVFKINAVHVVLIFFQALLPVFLSRLLLNTRTVQEMAGQCSGQ